METICATRILILGAGFGGLYTADRLEKLCKHDPSVEITIVDKHNYFLYTPMLHASATGSLEPRYIAHAVRKSFRKRHVYPHIAAIQKIDLEKKTVTTSRGELKYDIVVISLGSETNFYGMKDVEERSFTLKSLSDAVKVNNHIINMLERARWEQDSEKRKELLTFVVVGAGPTGVELAGEIQEYIHNELHKDYPRVSLSEMKVVLVEATDRILPSIERNLADEAVKRLQKIGVEVRLSTPVKGFQNGVVDMGEKGKLRTQTMIWAAGVRNSKVIEDLPLAKDRMGRIMVEPTLQIKEYPNVYVLGDNSHCIDPSTGKPYPPTAQVAVRQAKVVAENVHATLHNRPLREFTHKDIGGFVSIGDNYAILAAKPFSLRGFLAWFAWNLVYIHKMPGAKNRLLVTLSLFLRQFMERNTAQLDIIQTEKDLEH